MHLPQNKFQQSWDSGIIETSSVRHYQNGTISPARKTSRIANTPKTKRTRLNYNKRNRAIKELILKRHPEIGFGFSVRGGIEHGTGIFISSIHQYSDAISQGLQVGDQILKANRRCFSEISHEEAVQFIQRLKVVKMKVLSLGKIPGSRVAFTEYQWMDCYGRPCSPLQMEYAQMTRSDGINESNDSNGTRLLEVEDERKVNVVVGENVRLGLLIRGGMEYGLGIFVAGIDEDSVADRTGIMVGEQILEVNGISFMNISHADAAHIIRTSKMMTIILKDVAKVPLARIIYDGTEWVSPGQNEVQNELVSRQSPKESAFQPGIAGRQLHRLSTASPMSYRWIEEKAQNYLSEDEWMTLKYYISEYVHGSITVNGLVLSMFDSLDTSGKMQLVGEIRRIVRAQDLDTFDDMVLKRKVQEIEIQNESASREASLSLEQEEQEDEQKNITIAQVLGNRKAKNKNLNKRIKIKDFHKYKTLAEEETMENMTEESLMSMQEPEEPESNGHPIIDHDNSDDFTENMQVIYSHVFKTKERKPKSILRTSDENERKYENNVQGVENVSDITNEAMRTEANSLDNVFKAYDDIYDDENEDTNDEDYANEIEQEDYDEDGADFNGNVEPGESYTRNNFDSNSLGIAFTFLADETTKEKSPAESDNGEKLQSDTPYKMSSDYDNNYKTLQKKEKNKNEDDMLALQKRVRYFRDLNVQTAEKTSTEKHLQSYIPKILYGSGEVEESPPDLQNVPENDFATAKELSPNYNEEARSEFDARPSVDHRISNFSVNDIIRQNYLPTTRLDYDPVETSVNLKESTKLSNSFEEQQKKRNMNLTRLSTLNIQNQYQYQNLNRSHSYSSESLSKEEPKTYGKPVMTKSPHADFSTPVNYESIRRKELDRSNSLEESFQFDISTLKRNKTFERYRSRSVSPLKSARDESEPLESSTLRKKVIEDAANYTIGKEEENEIINTSFNEFNKKRQIFANRNTEELGYKYQPKESQILTFENRKNLDNVDASKLGKELKASDGDRAKSLPILAQNNLADIYSIRSRIEVFSRPDISKDITFHKKQMGGGNWLNNQYDSTEKKETNRTPNKRLISIPRTKEDPGFTVDNRTGDNGNELFIAEIQNDELKKKIRVGDVILGIDNTQFKKDLKKGLANIIIQTAFNSSKEPNVILNIR